MAEHNDLGTKGEGLAATFLKSKGFTILETNWRHGNMEADIIAVHSGVMILAEVKTRTSNFFGDPETFVTKQKQSNLRRAANGYIQQKQLDLEVRFDIISILMDKATGNATINHMEGAFLFGN